MSNIMKQVMENWKLIVVLFGGGFIFATMLCVGGFYPNEFNILGVSYKLPNCNDFPQTPTPQNMCALYDFKINEPDGGYKIENGQVLISGFVEEIPQDGSVWLITKVDNYDPITYWPQTEISIDKTSNKWHGIINAEPNITGAIVVLNKSDQILFNYIEKVLRKDYENNIPYTELQELPEDIQTCLTFSIH